MRKAPDVKHMRDGKPQNAPDAPKSPGAFCRVVWTMGAVVLPTARYSRDGHRSAMKQVAHLGERAEQ
jgi:hypothetical protein